MIAAQNGELKLDTGTFGFRDLKDKDQARQRQMSANLNIGSGSPPGETSEGGPTITVDGSYYDKDVEGVSRATVSGGDGVDINIRDKDSQAELVDSGKTQDVAAINQDVDKAQEITKDDELGFSFYASDTSVKKAADIISDVAKTIVDRFVSDGKLSTAEGERVKEIVEKLRDIDPDTLAACGGNQGFNFWNIIIGTAHAADGCSIRFKDKFQDISAAEYDAVRQAIAAAAEQGIKDELRIIQALEAKQASGPLSDSEARQLSQALGRLNQHAAYFELCSPDPGSLRNAGLLPAGSFYQDVISGAENYRLGGDAIARQIGDGGADLLALRQTNPAKFNALYFAAYGASGEVLDGLYKLYGLSQNDQLTGEKRQAALDQAFEGLKGAVFPRDITAFSLDAARSEQAIATLAADLTLSDKVYLARQFQNYLETVYKPDIEASVERAQVATAGIVGALFGIQATPAVARCLADALCRTEAVNAAAELAAGDALGGGSLAPTIGAASVAAKSKAVQDAVTEIADDFARAGSSTARATNRVPDVSDNVPYFRVQGGQGARPGQISQERLSVNADGTVSINPGCSGQLCVSVEGPDHAAYYLSQNRPDGTVVVFEVDRATHNRIMEAAVDQSRARSAPVQITDRNTPGTSIQLNDAFAELMASGSSKGRVLSQQEFLNEFGGN